MSWALEEYVEDAVVDYLKQETDADKLNIYPAWSDEEIRYPCAVINAGKSENVEGTEFNGVREIEVEIGIITEAASTTVKAAREHNREIRDLILTALAQTQLHQDLNTMNPIGVIFSLAKIGGITRSLDAEHRAFVSEITLRCIASPKVVV